MADFLTALSRSVAAHGEGREIARERDRKDLLTQLAQQRQVAQDAQEAERTDLLNQLTRAQTAQVLEPPKATPRRTQVVDGQLVDMDAGTATQIAGFVPEPKQSPTPAAGSFTQFTGPDGRPVFFNPQTGASVSAPQGFEPPSTRAGLPTEGERKAAGLLLTGENGYKNLQRLLGQPEDDPATAQREDETPGKSAPGFFNRQLSRIGMGIGNIASSDDLRQIDQAAYDLTEAWLRLTSGGAITPQEIRDAAKAIIPQAGDDDATRMQKARSRRLRVEALRQAAGRAEPTGAEDANTFTTSTGKRVQVVRP